MGPGESHQLPESCWGPSVSKSETYVCVSKGETMGVWLLGDHGGSSQLRVQAHERQSVPATGVGLWSWGLLYPGGSNWRDWDPGADY